MHTRLQLKGGPTGSTQELRSGKPKGPHGDSCLHQPKAHLMGLPELPAPPSCSLCQQDHSKAGKVRGCLRFSHTACAAADTRHRSPASCTTIPTLKGRPWGDYFKRGLTVPLKGLTGFNSGGRRSLQSVSLLIPACVPSLPTGAFPPLARAWV